LCAPTARRRSGAKHPANLIAPQPDILEDVVVERAEHDVSSAAKTPLVKGGQQLPAEAGSSAFCTRCWPRHGHDGH
jgi:hypothetical protein